MRWVLRAGIVAGIVLILSVIPYQRIRGSGSGKLGAMQQELRRVEAEIGQTTDEVRDRRLRVDALKNDTQTIEAIARQELHMLYPHEKTLRLGDVEPPRSADEEAR